MTTRAAGPPPLPASDLDALVVLPAGVVNLRRDLYGLMRYVEERGLVRTRRGNLISRTDARRLAKRLSWSGEAEALEREGGGVWSDYVSHLARRLKVVDFDTEGQYVGYTSTEPSFIDNETVIQDEEWNVYLRMSPLVKEKALLDVLLETTESEFFRPATLVDGEAFDRWGSATGPASRMKLPGIRRRLLEVLASFEAEVWYEMSGLVQLVKEREPGLILDPAKRENDPECERRLREWERQEKRRAAERTARKKTRKPESRLEDIYTNFREFAAGESRFHARPHQITSKTASAFNRVEGRYLEFFLREVPYLCGFVDLAYRSPSDPHGLDVSPPFERLRAFRLRQRFFQLMSGDVALDHVKVTVLPTFEVVVEAPSYPDGTLEKLEPLTSVVKEEGPLHLLRVERNKVVETVARDPAATPVEVLAGLTAEPLPENVATELQAWSNHGEKVVFYQGYGLLEFRGGANLTRGARKEVGGLLEEAGLERYAVVRDPERALRLLEEGGHVPLRVKHDLDVLSPELEPSAAGTDRTPRAPEPRRSTVSAVKVRLESEDLVGYRVPDATLLEALRTALEENARTCFVVDDRLVVSAAALPELRRALRRLRERFDVDVVGADSRGATNR